MTAVANPISITYGDREVGGSTAYAIHGPYVIDISYTALRLVFDVIVVSTSFKELVDLSGSLETDFRKRLVDGDTLVIDIDGTPWTYTVGSSLLHAVATISKSGNRDTDMGYSRAYTVTIEAELPADAAGDGGLRDIEVQVAYSPSQQKTVTMRGVYTATSDGTALSNYTANCDARAADYLTLVDSAATWELVTQSYSLDREMDSDTPSPQVLTFSRQYVQLLANQSAGMLDDSYIRDHQVTFTDVDSYPGDSSEGLVRLHRVTLQYSAAVDVEESMDVQAIYTTRIRPHMLTLFEASFLPSDYGVAQEQSSFDKTGSRVLASMVFLFQPSGADSIVEVTQSLTIRESRTIDYTPVHTDDELAAYADVGWASIERVWNRTMTVVGTEAAGYRIAESLSSGSSGSTGFSDSIGFIPPPDDPIRPAGTGSGIPDGWNVIASTRQITPQWIGVPGLRQIELSIVSETVVERYHRSPGGSGRLPGFSGGTG